MKLKAVFLLLTACYFISCASAPEPRLVQNSFSIEKGFDEVWTAVIESFSDLNLPIDNIEKASGLITTDWIDFTGQSNEEYCDCGGLGINVEVLRVGKFNVFVKKITDDSCEIRTNSVFEQEIRFGDGPLQKRKCVSTGNLEAEMINLIKDNLNI